MRRASKGLDLKDKVAIYHLVLDMLEKEPNTGVFY